MDKIEDILYQAAKFYAENLVDKKFEIVVERKEIRRTYVVNFFVEHFYHLIGLHKLKDIPALKRNRRIIFREIIDGKITYSDIAKSRYFLAMADRLIYHREIFNVLNIDSVFFRSTNGRFKGIDAECVIYHNIADTMLFSFLFFQGPNNLDMSPVSFFTRDENIEYTKNATNWKVISISDITYSETKSNEKSIVLV
ncbi:MAG: PBECR4 domain-containing protein [Eubacteriales bacterium]